jgi:hypothetical protein
MSVLSRYFSSVSFQSNDAVNLLDAGFGAPSPIISVPFTRSHMPRPRGIAPREGWTRYLPCRRICRTCYMRATRRLVGMWLVETARSAYNGCIDSLVDKGRELCTFGEDSCGDIVTELLRLALK